MTDTARDILRSLSLVRQFGGAAMTMIAGAPGVGKSEALKHYAAQNGAGCIYIQAVRGEGTPWNFAHSIAAQFGYGAPDFHTVQEARMRFAQALGPDCLLIVDEAQYLDQKNRRTGRTGEALEWVRGMAKTGGFPVVLCGDLSLPNTEATMPQLQSRMRRPVYIPRVTPGDVQAMAVAEGFTDPAAARVLEVIAALRGGLRNVENVARLAQLFAGDGKPDLSHLKAAIVDMKLAPKGSK
ncbi:AAA family ATPase [Meridianimarinicoccus aquatilis]|nr:AAA family ATPase [Fluviibacterium aquatile]